MSDKAEGPKAIKPTVGRVVHYYSELYRNHKEPRAAIITEVCGGEGPVGLMVLRPYSDVDDHGENPVHIVAAEYSEKPAPGCWSWPPRVEG